MLLRRRSFCSSARGTPMARQNRPGDVSRRRPVIQSSHVSPPPNCPKSSCRQGLDKYSSPCATEQRSDLEPGGFPSIPPPEKPKWLQSRCLATASHSVKGRGYSHVRTSDCSLDGRSDCVKPEVRGVGPFSGYSGRLRRRFVYGSAGDCRLLASYARSWWISLRDRVVA